MNRKQHQSSLDDDVSEVGNRIPEDCVYVGFVERGSVDVSYEVRVSKADVENILAGTNMLKALPARGYYGLDGRVLAAMLAAVDTRSSVALGQLKHYFQARQGDGVGLIAWGRRASTMRREDIEREVSLAGAVSEALWRVYGGS